jgi:Family of unknown function (DUF6496)
MDTRFRDQCHDRLLGLPTNFGTKLTFPNTGTWAATARFLWGTETGRNSMASETPRQKRITGRVMHEFKHGELKSGRNGKGGTVKSRRQAIAIALEEAGASRYESQSRNRRNFRRTEKKEAEGRTGQQEREGKSHVGAYRKRESTRAMAGRNARGATARGRKAATTRSRKSDGHTRQELYAKAKRKRIEGRSRMSKRQLENALGMR